VHSSKVDHPSSGCKLAAVNDLCLSCIRFIFTARYGTVPEIGDVFFTKELQSEWFGYYSHFYTIQEKDEMDLWETDEEIFLCFDRSMQRIMPWLSKRGVRRTCPHVPGACPNIQCCRGTETMPVLDAKPNAARLVVGKRNWKKGKEGKCVSKQAAM
jgi:hypothetical protein